MVLTLFQIARLENEVRRFTTQLERYLFNSFVFCFLTAYVMNGLTFFKLLLAAASMILRPVTVEPVNATLSTSI
jgi:hypothetical protein